MASGCGLVVVERCLCTTSAPTMTGLTDIDRTLLRTALKAAKRHDAPSVGMPTATLERLLAYLAVLEGHQTQASAGAENGSD